MITIASLIPFISVISDPSLIVGNQYLNLIYNYFEFTNNNNFIVFLGLFFLSLVIFSNISYLLNIWVTNFFIFKIGAQISENLFKYYLRDNIALDIENSSSKLSSKIVLEVHRFVDGVLFSYLTIIFKSFFLFFVFILLLIFNTKITLVGFSAIFIFYISIFLLVKKPVIKFGKKISDLQKLRLKLISEVFFGIKEVKIFNQVKYFQDKFKNFSSDLNKKIAFNRSVSASPRYLLELLALGGLCLLAIFSHISSNGNLSEFIPIVSIYIFAGYKLLPSSQTIFSSLTTLSSETSSFLNFKDDLLNLRMGDNLVNKSNSKKEATFKKFIKFTDVCLQYENTNFEISNFNLEILENDYVGIYGKSGSGKSSVINILCGFIKQTSGKINIDNDLMSELNLKSWWAKISYVPQSVYIFDDTLKNNIVMRENLDSNLLNEVINFVGLDYLITTPNNYDILLGEKGSQISGGEAQRIGIARAIYKKSKILILDEFTSALDEENENKILEVLLKLKGKITVVLVTHKKKVLEICNKKVLMNNGKIIKLL
jgi:ABC-type bacteriocin/lantibiotic exporter with double-glycine peptidase domain